jgi:hypothetical protein
MGINKIQIKRNNLPYSGKNTDGTWPSNAPTVLVNHPVHTKHKSGSNVTTLTLYFDLFIRTVEQVQTLSNWHTSSKQKAYSFTSR